MCSVQEKRKHGWRGTEEKKWSLRLKRSSVSKKIKRTVDNGKFWKLECSLRIIRCWTISLGKWILTDGGGAVENKSRSCAVLPAPFFWSHCPLYSTTSGSQGTLNAGRCLRLLICWNEKEKWKLTVSLGFVGKHMNTHVAKHRPEDNT